MYERAAVRRALARLGWSGAPRWADGFWSRLIGMLAEPSRRDGEVPPIVVFPQCRSVHTCGMRCPLDIAFIDENGRVLSSYERVGPWRFLHEPRACFVVERMSAGAPERARPLAVGAK